MTASLDTALVRFNVGSLWTTLRRPVLVAAAYFLAAEAAFFIGTLSDRIFAPFWPPNIVLFCALLITPQRDWWRYLIAVFPAHVIAELGVGMGWPQLLVAFVTNCAIAATNSWAAQRFISGPPWLNSLRKGTIYVLTTALLSPALWAFVGALMPIVGGDNPASYWKFWMQWYLANAMASLTLGPIAITLFCEGRKLSKLLPSRHLIEFIVITLCLFLACMIAFQASGARVPNSLRPTLLYLPLPLILWSAARFGGKGVSVAIFTAMVGSIWGGLDGPSAFAFGDVESNVLALQTFLIGLAAPLILLGAAVDEARHAETTTREAEERMAFAAASANIGLWQLSADGRDLWATDFCRSMFGFASFAKMRWNDILNCVHPEDRDAINRTLDDAAQSGAAATCEFRIHGSGEQARWLTMSAHVERDESYQPTRISGLFSDITPRKAAEAELELQRRELAHLMRVSMLGELSGALAHELNQPLTAILANAEAARRMLAKGKPVLSEIGEMLDDIVEDDKRAGEVIQRLHRLLKKGDFKSEPIDLNDLIASTLRLVHSQLISRKIRVQVHLAGDVPTPIGDAVQLQQVFLNVIMNAIEAMASTPPSRRALKVETRLATPGRAEVAVTDQGPGLTEEQQKRIFEPFFTTKDHGLGLGLAICSTIVTSHGGQIKISDNRGEGTAAIISLPVKPAQALAEAV